jgi:DNA mismatch endonuclease, patch repair protein
MRRTGKGAGLVVDRETSARMARVRQRGTKPELLVRKMLSGLGLRYRTRNRDLPGSPDLANRRAGWAIFVHGCFWHAHRSCSKATLPKRNRAFWMSKFSDNRARDGAAVLALRASGYRAVVIWQCELERDPVATRRRLRVALIPSARNRR